MARAGHTKPVQALAGFALLVFPAMAGRQFAQVLWREVCRQVGHDAAVGHRADGSGAPAVLQ